MTRDRTHYVGDDCPGGHHSAYLTDDESAQLLAAQFGPPPASDLLAEIAGQVTDEDVERASDAGYWIGRPEEEPDMRAALATAYRPGGIVGRAVADELERIANGTNLPLRPDLLRLAAEWREGRR